MPTIRLREHEPFDSAMRRFKRLCEKAGIPGKLRQIEFYEKKTVKRRRKKAAAIKRLKKQQSINAETLTFAAPTSRYRGR